MRCADLTTGPTCEPCSAIPGVTPDYSSAMGATVHRPPMHAASNVLTGGGDWQGAPEHWTSLPQTSASYSVVLSALIAIAASCVWGPQSVQHPLSRRTQSSFFPHSVTGSFAMSTRVHLFVTHATRRLGLGIMHASVHATSVRPQLFELNSARLFLFTASVTGPHPCPEGSMLPGQHPSEVPTQSSSVTQSESPTMAASVLPASLPASPGSSEVAPPQRKSATAATTDSAIEMVFMVCPLSQLYCRIGADGQVRHLECNPLKGQPEGLCHAKDPRTARSRRDATSSDDMRSSCQTRSSQIVLVA